MHNTYISHFSLSLLYFLCQASPYPVLRTCIFSWCWMTLAFCLNNLVIKSYTYGIWKDIYVYHESGCSLEICQWCREPCFAGAKIMSEVGFEPTPTEVDCDLNAAKSKLLYDWRSVSQYVLVSSTLVGFANRYYFLSECCCLKFAVLFLWSALSDDKTGLQFAV
jgi:hypothetical protein